MAKIGAFSGIVPVIMTETEEPDRQPEGEAPETGSRWGGPSDFQFLIEDFEKTNPLQPTGNNEVWEDDKHVTSIEVEALWAPEEEEGSGWTNPFGIKRGFNVFTRESRTTYTSESGCDDGVSVCGEGFIQRPDCDTEDTDCAAQTQPFKVYWDVQTTTDIDCDMGDEQVDEITGVGADGTVFTQPVLYKRRLHVDFFKDDFGGGSGQGTKDIPGMPGTCTCR